RGGGGSPSTGAVRRTDAQPEGQPCEGGEDSHEDGPVLYDEDIPTESEDFFYVVDTSGDLDWGTASDTVRPRAAPEARSAEAR
ncbi:hypothetical protein ACFL59_10840, partial [Planctomycetota bacterium]